MSVKTKIFFRRINSEKHNAQAVEKEWGQLLVIFGNPPPH